MRLAAAFILCTGPAAAQAVDCSAPQTQADMTHCAGLAYQAADADLNATYQLAMNDWLGGRNAPSGQALLTAQRAWLSYRDAHCSAVAAKYEGGSIQPMMHADCLTRLTKARTEEIRAYAEPY